MRVIDFMPPRRRDPEVVRIVEGVRGHVAMHMELIIRFDYGSVVPWVGGSRGALRRSPGPTALPPDTGARLRGEDLRPWPISTSSEGDRVPFVLTWYPSHEAAAAGSTGASARRDTGMVAAVVGALHLRGQWATRSCAR